MKLWSYAFVDKDLIRDDVDACETLAPAVAWTTERAAKDAAAEAFYEDWKEAPESAPVVEWTEKLDGFWFAPPDHGDFAVWVYPIAVAEGGA